VEGTVCFKAYKNFLFKTFNNPFNFLK